MGYFTAGADINKHMHVCKCPGMDKTVNITVFNFEDISKSIYVHINLHTYACI